MGWCCWLPWEGFWAAGNSLCSALTVLVEAELLWLFSQALPSCVHRQAVPHPWAGQGLDQPWRCPCPCLEVGSSEFPFKPNHKHFIRLKMFEVLLMPWSACLGQRLDKVNNVGIYSGPSVVTPGQPAAFQRLLPSWTVVTSFQTEISLVCLHIRV